MKPYYENKPEKLDVSQSSLKHFPAHLHINLELMYIEKGESVITVNGKKYDVDQGDMVVVFPNMIHSYDNETDDEIATFIIFNSEFFEDTILTFMNYEPINPVIKSNMIHEDVQYAIRSLCKEVQYNEVNTDAARSLIKLILSRILPIMQLKKSSNNKGTNLISDIVTYICNNYTKEISLDTLSENFGVNKYYISKIFNSKIQISLSDYVNGFRIELAKKLLKSNEEMSILEISEQCGFETQRSFNRVFQKFCGTSPREFRKL